MAKITRRQFERVLCNLIDGEGQLKDIDPSIGHALSQVIDAVRRIADGDEISSLRGHKGKTLLTTTPFSKKEDRCE